MNVFFSDVVIGQIEWRCLHGTLISEFEAMSLGFCLSYHLPLVSLLVFCSVFSPGCQDVTRELKTFIIFKVYNFSNRLPLLNLCFKISLLFFFIKQVYIFIIWNYINSNIGKIGICKLFILPVYLQLFFVSKCANTHCGIVLFSQYKPFPAPLKDSGL